MPGIIIDEAKKMARSLGRIARAEKRDPHLATIAQMLFL
jgi:hypothetical protein